MCDSHLKPISVNIIYPNLILNLGNCSTLETRSI